MVQIIQSIKKKKLKNLIFNFLNSLILILYPHKCPSCKKIVKEEGFCVDCWKKLVFIEKPYCFICGKPLLANKEKNIICGDCINKKYYFDRVFSVFQYNDTIAKAIFEFKFHEKTFLSKFFTKFLFKKIKECDEKIDFITCVPMHLKKLRNRGYNQSLLLVKDLSKQTNITYIDNLLIKTKNTKAQVQLNSANRKVNLKSAFTINSKYINIIKNKNILIVDDVFTTGSTINECAKVLKKYSKANRIFTITIAKVVKNM